MVDWLKKSSFFIILGMFIIVFLFITREKEETSHSEITPISPVSDEKDGSNEPLDEKILVDIKGEINEPGVYELNLGARVNDVIKLAAGFTDKADETAINLAQKVQDEMIIIVPSEDDEFIGINHQQSGSNQSEKVRINYATQEEIETLPGIGPSKAQAIIQYREENGLFQAIEDLLDISGIGEKTLENMRENIQIP